MSVTNLRQAPEFAKLAEVIKQKAVGRKVYYAPNGGNWGDALIHQGILQFLNFYQIAFTELSRADFRNIANGFKHCKHNLVNSLLITSGCGNWCHNWFAARNFIIDTHWLFDEIIVLPTSFELPQIDNLDHKITYFARDKFTSLDTIKNAQFCHDMAFFLEITDLDLSASNRDGYFFRIDKEKSSQQPPVPKSSFDLSAISHDRQNVVPFFKILSAYKTITTDRLHIAIAASLMGKETQLYMGSYFKSKDVYYSSIESNYPNTKFIPYD